MRKENFFVKTTQITNNLTTEQRVKLNRRGNELFNAGKIEIAAKIFVITGYSDGLTRVGDFYYGENKKLDALKYYKLANNQHNVNIIVSELANIVRMMVE